MAASIGDSGPYTGDVTPGGPPDTRELAGMIVTKLAVDPKMSNNCYLLRCRATDEQVLIDAAADFSPKAYQQDTTRVETASTDKNRFRIVRPSHVPRATRIRTFLVIEFARPGRILSRTAGDRGSILHNSELVQRPEYWLEGGVFEPAAG